MPIDAESLSLIVLGGVLASGNFAKTTFENIDDLPVSIRGLVRALRDKSGDELPDEVTRWLKAQGVEHVSGKRIIEELLEVLLIAGQRDRARRAAYRLNTLSKAVSGPEWLEAAENILKPLKESWSK